MRAPRLTGSCAYHQDQSRNLCVINSSGRTYVDRRRAVVVSSSKKKVLAAAYPARNVCSWCSPGIGPGACPVYLHPFLMAPPIRILGVSAFYHDSAAAMVRDGEIVAAAQEERFTRKKHDAGFPSHAVAYCLEAEGVTLKDVDYVVFYDKPFLKFERLLESYLAVAPRGLRSFQMSIPLWIRQKLF